MTSHPIEIDVETLRDKFVAGEDFLLVDCREPDEFETVRLEHATLIPMSEIARRVDELEPHRGREIVVHCHHGGRSLRVVMWLRQRGFGRVSNLAGGIDAWSERIDLDVDYVERQSAVLDLRILARTLTTMLSGEGVEGHPTDDPLAAPPEGP